jgi:hypothetical protein
MKLGKTITCLVFAFVQVVGRFAFAYDGHLLIVVATVLS